MRHLFLVLVLMNLAFAAWSAWSRRPSAPGARPTKGCPLTLVGEVPVDLRSGGVAADVEPAAPIEVGQPPLDAAPDAAPSAELDADAGAAGGDEAAAADSAAEVEASCTSVGPFRELSQAAAAAATLRGAGYQPQQRVAEGEVWSGYWVYIPAIPTEQEANEALAKVREGLREARIPDAYVIRNSDSGNRLARRAQRDQRRRPAARRSARARFRAASRRSHEPCDRVLDRHRARAGADARLRRASAAGPHHPARATRVRYRVELAIPPVGLGRAAARVLRRPFFVRRYNAARKICARRARFEIPSAGVAQR